MTRAMLLVLLVPFALAGPVLADIRENASDVPVEPGVPAIGPVWAPTGAVLYDNGPVANSFGTGVGGADESILQSVTFGMNTLGFGHQWISSIDNRIADDFEVPAGDTWDISSITFFAYQTNSGPVSTITGVYWQIWDAQPPAGNVIYGNLTTNRLVTTSWSGVYRVTETTTGTSTARPIMANVTSPMGTLQLPSGTYWIVWQTDGSGSSGPWANPIAILGQTTTGNGLQSVDSGITFPPALDSGTATQQGFPFIIEGSTGPIGVEPSSFAKIKSLYR